MSVETMAEGPEQDQPKADHGTAKVTKHLDRAIQAAREGGMPTSELMGILFYYAHSIAESFRAEALKRAAESQ